MVVWIVLQEPADSLPVERSTGLFDSDSVVFQNTLLLTSSLLISCLLLGIMHEIIRYTRSRAKIKPHGRIFESNSIIKLNYVSFDFPPWKHASWSLMIIIIIIIIIMNKNLTSRHSRILKSRPNSENWSSWNTRIKIIQPTKKCRCTPAYLP